MRDLPEVRTDWVNSKIATKDLIGESSRPREIVMNDSIGQTFLLPRDFSRLNRASGFSLPPYHTPLQNTWPSGGPDRVAPSPFEEA